MEFKGTRGKWEKVTADWDLNQSVFLEDTEEIICDVKSLSHNAIYDALLISKAPEMIEKLAEIVNVLDIKCTDGCENKTWKDFQNGNGEDVGLEIDKFIKEAKQLIKEATEL